MCKPSTSRLVTQLRLAVATLQPNCERYDDTGSGSCVELELRVFLYGDNATTCSPARKTPLIPAVGGSIEQKLSTKMSCAHTLGQQMGKVTKLAAIEYINLIGLNQYFIFVFFLIKQKKKCTELLYVCVCVNLCVCVC